MSDENSKSNSKGKIKAGTESLIRKEITDRLEKGAGGGSYELTEQAKSDLEKRIVLDFAKEKGLWIENLYDLGHPIRGGGNENTLALNNKTGKLYKSNNLFNTSFLISKLLKQIEAHNFIFPETKYELVGFCGIDGGEKRTPHIEVVLSQEFVPHAVQVPTNEIIEFMISI